MSLLNGLVSYYKLNGNSNDSLGVNNGVDTDITYVAGKIKQAASFNGSTSYINIGNQANFSGASEFTIAAWLDTNVLDSLNHFAVSKWDSEAQWILRLGSNNLFQFYWNDGATESIAANGVTMAVNQWYYVVATFKIGEQNIYVNNILYGTSALTGQIVASTNNVMIGIQDTGLNNPFNGLIDEIGIWNRVLSQREITQLYNGGRGLSYPFNGSNFFRFFR